MARGQTAFAVVISRVRASLKAHDLLPPDHRVLLAISGGQDSLTLAESLRHIQQTTAPRLWPSLTLAHCDHRWPHDEGIAAHVSSYAKWAGLPLHVFDAGDAPPEATESAAREWRYGALSSLAKEHGFDAVVTGHTRTDLAETVLFNLSHGAGADGLSAMAWQRPLCEGVKLVRPMLGVSREETSSFCEEVGLSVWNDVYNEDRKYARNRVRGDVMPVLKEALHGRVEEALARTAHLLREDSKHLEAEADRLFERVVVCGSDGRVRMDRGILGKASVALQRRVVRRVLRECLGVNHRRALFPQIEAVCALVDTEIGKVAPSLVRGSEAKVVCNRWIEIGEKVNAKV